MLITLSLGHDVIIDIDAIANSRYPTVQRAVMDYLLTKLTFEELLCVTPEDITYIQKMTTLRLIQMLLEEISQ